MPEKKFDLSKVLQAAQLYTPIDYGYTPQFDIQTSQDNFNNTADDVLSEIDWVGSGVRARKEEQEKRDNTPWYSKLGYAAMSSSNPGDVPTTSALAADHYMVGDVEGGKNIQKTQDTIGSIAGTAATLGPYAIADFAKTAGTYGVGSALAAEGLSWGTGIAGYHGFNKLGQYIDNKRGTNIAPYLSFFGSLGTGVAGYSAGLKTAAGLAKSAINHGIRGYSDFKPALTDMMIKYTKPKKLGNISFSPSESHTRFFNTRGSESGMNTYFKTAKYAGNTGSYNGRVVPSWQLPRGERNQLQFLEPNSKYGNLRFIRNLGVVPEVENGMVRLAPRDNNLLNLTSDLPFRRHKKYNKTHAHYIYMRPEAFAGHAPLSIDPMDTMFINQGISIDPKNITFLSGDVNALREARKRGFRVKSFPELIKTFNIGESNVVNGIQLGKTDFNGSANTLQYATLVDEYFTKLGRPDLSDYRKLETRTGLNSHVSDISLRDVIDDKINKYLNAKSYKDQIALIDNGYLFKYPDNFGPPINKIKRPIDHSFYKNIFYNPATPMEESLMTSIGYPQHPRNFNVSEFAERTKHFLGNALKQGGKI